MAHKVIQIRRLQCTMGHRLIVASLPVFGNFTTCGVEPLPAECEILDLNRSNDIDNVDPYLFMQNCFTGPGGGESAGGGTSEGGEEEVTDPLDDMVQWCLAAMSAGERAELADVVRDGAGHVDAVESARMNRFADAIDPVE